jgi:diaminohydroxyphosphoribosylaminopyrimidine deaminase/5-amino-6-(5-phosphoribosylamino)uracil reductase
MDDGSHMRAALALAARGLGNTWPNPAVGCVIVRGGRVVGRGWTAPGGRPHAETRALAEAGEQARGATAYVTLEPCSHHGKTPPCADALAAAGIARCVVALGDPDPRVNGRGVDRLRAAGIEVEMGLLAREAEDAQAGFLSRVREGRPLVTLKLATTLDGRIATEAGESQWITGPEARRLAHAMRGRHDAVMVGIGTALADDPALTCRLPGFKPVPDVRIVVDTHLRLPPHSTLARTAREAPVWVLHGPDASAQRREALSDLGVMLIGTGAGQGGLDLAAALQALGAAGLTRLLVEGGAGLAGGLLCAGVVDRLAWFHAPAVLGADALAAISPLGVATLAAMPRFRRVAARRARADWFTEFQLPGEPMPLVV